jgi:hypothetical protein
MHGAVKQEDLYQNCEFHYLRGRGFASRAGPKMMCSVCAHLNIFNFLLITTAPILFKFDMMPLWDKGDINCEFQVSYPPGAFGAGQKVSKLTNF